MIYGAFLDPNPNPSLIPKLCSEDVVNPCKIHSPLLLFLDLTYIQHLPIPLSEKGYL